MTVKNKSQKGLHLRRIGRWFIRLSLPLLLLVTVFMGVRAIVTDLSLVGELHEPQAEHVSQADLLALVMAGQTEEAFEEAFELGDELFETAFNALDGVGANVGQGQRFSRVPRADLTGPGEWANHVPIRATGPNAEACNDCHNTPFDDGAGEATSNNIRDPFHTGSVGSFINRQAPHVFAPGAVQRLAEEMTAELHAIREQAIAEATSGGTIFADDFESDKGWVFNPNGTDTAVTGQWERGNPQGTSFNGIPMQLDVTTSEFNNLVTGAAGGFVGDHDIDGGITSVRSLSFNIPITGSTTLSFNFYMAHLSNSSNADFFRVTAVGASSIVILEERGAANNDAAAFTTFSASLGALAGQTVHLLIEAADNAGSSLVEAAVDDVSVEFVTGPVTKALIAKGVSFGTITAFPDGSVDTSQVEGVSEDLIIRPFDWKGNTPFVRDFNRGASHQELGMQAVELTGYDVDGDGDSVINEMTVGDQTALAIYLAAQPRPTTLLELSDLGLIPPLSPEEVAAINQGQVVFGSLGCASCHAPQFLLDDPIFSEPSQNPNYRDVVFPSGLDPLAEGVDPAFPVTFDLTEDQPDNVIVDGSGNIIFRLGSFVKNSAGQAVVEVYGDLKQHDMGPGLAESIDEVGTGASVFLTENLWGVGSTAPYLHDGRATTVTEAILEHGGEAAASRDAFLALSLEDQTALIAFLENLVLFKMEEE